MSDFYENIFKIIDSVDMCDKHRNELTYKFKTFFKNNKFDPSVKYVDDKCCKDEPKEDTKCCKDK